MPLSLTPSHSLSFSLSLSLYIYMCIYMYIYIYIYIFSFSVMLCHSLVFPHILSHFLVSSSILSPAFSFSR